MTVHNQGEIGTGQFGIAVDFYSYGIERVVFDPLSPDGEDSIEVGIPTGCFDSDCEFTITLDVDDDVAESNEANNTVDGTCIG